MAKNTGQESRHTTPLTTVSNPRAATWIKPSSSGVFVEAKSCGGAFARRPWWRRLLGR